MAWAKVSTGTGTHANNAAISPAWPSHSTGNLGLAFVSGGGAISIATPGGWTLLHVYDPGNHATYLFGKIATSGSESAPTFTPSGGASGNLVAGYIDVWSGGLDPLTGIVSGTPVDQSSSGDTSAEYGTYTPSHDNTLTMIICTQPQNAGSPSTPGGFTQGNHYTTTDQEDAFVYYVYQIQTTAAAVSSGAITGLNQASQHRTSVLALRPAAAGPAPTFDTSPTISSQTDSAYTIGYEADANATNIYVGAYPKDATAPTAAQLKAGTGAHGTATEATTGAADSIVLTPSDSPKFPVYDIYAVLEGAGGFSSVVALTDEFLDPPAGKQFVTLTSVHATSPWNGTSVVAGDIVVIDTLTDPDLFAVTCEVDGTVSYAAGGSEDRQLIDAQVYDLSGATYFAADVLVFNNLAPVPLGGESIFDQEPLLFRIGVDIDPPIDLEILVTDPEGDSIIVTSDVTPPGFEDPDTDEEIDGTPSTYGETEVEFTWTDQYGDFYSEPVTIQVGDLSPDVVGLSEAAAVAAIEAVGNFVASAGTASSATVPEGDVISQNPAAGVLLPPGSTITITVSLGNVSVGSMVSEIASNLINSRRSLRNIPLWEIE